MGYESKLYIGRLTNLVYYDTETKSEKSDILWFQDYASVDMCKIGGLTRNVNDMSFYQKVYIFGTDGDTMITEDRYSDQLVAIPIEHVYDIIINRMKTDDYIRYKWVEALMKSMIETQNNLYVVHFGY